MTPNEIQFLGWTIVLLLCVALAFVVYVPE